METTSLPVRSSPEREAELLDLINSFRAAQDADDRVAALRLIDRAWRVASKNPEINYLYGLWLVRNGSAKAAVSLLETAAAAGNDPNIEAIFISALCTDGEIERARDRIRKALGSFAVAIDSPLAATARQVAIACQPQVAGWIGVAPDLKLHGAIVGERGSVPLRVIGPERTYDLEIDCGQQEYTAFAIPDDISVGAGEILTGVHELPLLGSGLVLPPDFGLDGRVKIAETALSGWAALKWNPAHALDVTLSGDKGVAATVRAIPDFLTGRHHFSFAQNIVDQAGNSVAVTVAMPNGEALPLPASPFLIQPPPPALNERRSARPPRKNMPAKAANRRGIDIVIPVYKGLDETLTCIRSVQRTAGADATIVVIDDASPDPRMARALDALARAGVIHLLRNDTNLGFPGTVNRGLALHPDRDVVILNSDTEVYGNWLDRLRIAAYSSPDIATVTPLTNSGSIASYPSSEDPAMHGETANEYDALASRLNAGGVVDIPTAVGFCLFVRRDCIDTVGLFDTSTFSKGYGEENDFCLRATALGWRHLLATDTYVKHSGSTSFGGLRDALLDRNLRLLNLRYPGYDAAITAYLDRDAAHGARRRIDEARLTNLGGRFALLVTLGLYGGVRRAVEERAAQLRGDGITPIMLKPDLKHAGRCVLSVDAQALEDLYFERDDLGPLFDLLRRLELDHIEIQHFLDLPGELIERLYELDRPIDIQIHDYIWYCPRITLLDEDARYCGEPGVAGCRACIKQNGSLLAEEIDVGALRKRSARWLRAARRITVPTQSVAARMAVKFPGLQYDIAPLEISPAPTLPGAVAAPNLKVAIIGAIGAHKGFDILLAMAKDAAKRDLPLEFVVIGYTQDDKSLFETGRVFVTGEYEEHELEQLITREHPDVALFVSQFPETWCYSLTHALRAQIPVAGFDFGAVGDRLAEMSSGPLLFPRTSTAAQISDGLLAAFGIASRKQNRIAKSVRHYQTGSGSNKTDILTNEIAPRPAALFSRRDMATTSNLPFASVEFVPLSQGLYLFSVKSAQASYRVDDQNGISLPAIQLSTAPGILPGQVELMLSPSTPTTWMSEPHDQIVVKVTAPSSVVLMTSVIIPGMIPLEIEVQRLDRAEAVTTVQVEPAQSTAANQLPPLPATRASVPLRITPHIQNRGDVEFPEGQWAGLPNDGFWIESLSIVPLADLTPDMIEYKAVTATGVETPWVSGGVPCGTRGIGVPLIGIAIRIKPQAGVENGMCEYGVILRSGTVLGPARNGMPCGSSDDTDPICGIWVSISGKPKVTAKPADATTPAPKKSGRSVAETAAPAKKSTKTGEKVRAPVGPRFSAFREQDNPEQE